ncbi:hypothetical protein CJK43_000995 [Salmonella enterica subsp. enterica serovar Miami]|nr:hypothetical protein [Salmonella enterica subsp. enterica serovar Miami]
MSHLLIGIGSGREKNEYYLKAFFIGGNPDVNLNKAWLCNRGWSDNHG